MEWRVRWQVKSAIGFSVVLAYVLMGLKNVLCCFLKPKCRAKGRISLKGLVTYCPAAALLGILVILLIVDKKKEKKQERSYTVSWGR